MCTACMCMDYCVVRSERCSHDSFMPLGRQEDRCLAPHHPMPHVEWVTH